MPIVKYDTVVLMVGVEFILRIPLKRSEPSAMIVMPHNTT